MRQEGVGYPRCADEQELLAELALYDNPFEEHIFVLCDATGAEIGCGGFLVSETDAACYLIGPLLDADRRTPALAEQAVRLLIDQPVAADRLLSYIEDANVVLVEALQAMGWQPGAAQLEMRYEVGSSAPVVAGGNSIRRMNTADDPQFGAIAEQLGRDFRWTTDPHARLVDYLKDGYQIALIEQDSQLAACILWITVHNTDFARLDYLSVVEQYRGRSLGSTLTRHMLAEVTRTPGTEFVYLSVNPANEVARRLYRACGFADNIHSRQFTYRKRRLNSGRSRGLRPATGR